MSEWSDETDDCLWRFADALDISRLEKFGLSDRVLFRLSVLQRNCDLFGIRAEEIGPLSTGDPGCRLFLWGSKFAHRITVEGNKEPAEISLATCNLDLPETWTRRFEGADVPACWYCVLSKIADSENVGFSGTPDMFQVPH